MESLGITLHDETVPSLISHRASVAASSPAIAAPGERACTYAELLTVVRETAFALAGLGIGRGDRVAIVLPNGPCMATAFLAVTSVAVAAPLNPAYREDEFDFYLTDLKAKVLIVLAGDPSPSRAVAARRKIKVVELMPERNAAGRFTLATGTPPTTGAIELARPSDVALMLHTSGTTSRPKLVPLSQRNLYCSALNIAQTLRLQDSDSCLNVMPLFHIHGLMGATLSTLASGGQVICTPGAKFPEFFHWMNAHGPTWYTAVPTIHQAVVANAAQFKEVIATRRLKFIRSSSSSLPPKVMADLEATFGAPVIEAYGMTEASHQMASNPLPPRIRKPGSVGIAAGPDVAIMDEAGNLLGTDQHGEIVIKGPSVTAGYEANPDANRYAFTSGWFHTGDRGYMDSERYLFLVGRIKEIINRGGEKISPREIDEVLLNHSAVDQAVAFAMPHPTLGEAVAAAVTVKSGQSATESELTAFVASRLADFKVPQRILLIDEIPKGPTGKVQRIGLYEKLKDRFGAEQAGGAPCTPVEERIAAIWREVLKVDKVGVNENFFSLGGDSLQALTVIALARKAGIDIDPTLSLQKPTVAYLATIAKELPSQEAAPTKTKGRWWDRIRKLAA